MRQGASKEHLEVASKEEKLPVFVMSKLEKV